MISDMSLGQGIPDLRHRRQPTFRRRSKVRSSLAARQRSMAKSRSKTDVSSRSLRVDEAPAIEVHIIESS